MPEVRPFRALRFSGERRDLSRVIAPPYDVIESPAEVAGLRERHPHNVVRLILPEDHPGQPDSRYRASREQLEAWLGEGALVQDPHPAFYPYRQAYRRNGSGVAERVGFLGLLRLEPFGRQVMAHENTLAGPREDRYRLLREVRVNLSPVFALFEDPGGHVRTALEAAMTRPWDARATRGGHDHGHDELWRMDEPEACETVMRALHGQPLVFADGHHRYESALRHLAEMRERGEDPGTAAYCVAFFAPVPQPGLSILPTHRVVHGLEAGRFAALEDTLRRFFLVRAAGRWDQPADVERWERAAPARPGRLLGFARRGDDTLWDLELLPGSAPEALAGLPGPLRDLDVSVLHEAVLHQALGIGEDALRRQANLRYLHDAGPALEQLRIDAQAVFLLRPTPIESVFSVARAGLRMPQKSTYFYPKVSTGFVLHRHERK
ncbi:MAG: DUF1015 domain-containing protein [Candidatus Eisenbacteria bacterium]|nr:DUF1015 domain-containing protein [Candidatus Eisenbacteria bacterium]